MVLACEDLVCEEHHPSWYACIVGIFHTDVYHVGENLKTNVPYRINFLWVCWFGLDGSYHGGWKARRLHWIGFFDSEEEHAFSFLDPDEIIQATHLIPVFGHGLIHNLPSDSLAHHPEDSTHEEWNIIM